MVNRLKTKGDATSDACAEISSKMPGMITNLAVDEGDQVTADGIVATVDKSQLLLSKKNAEKMLAQATAGEATAAAGVAAAQTGLEQAKAAILQAEAGINVAHATIKQAEAGVSQADAGVTAAMTGYETVSKDHERIENLFNNDGISRQNLDHVALEKDLANARLKQAEQGRILAEANASKAIEMLAVSESHKYQSLQGLAAATAMLEQAKQQLIAASTGVEQATIGIEIAELMLDNANVRSPITGVIVKKMMNLGEMAAPGKPIFQVEDQSTIEVKATVSSIHLQKLKVGIPAIVTMDGVAESVVATLTEIAPSVDQKTRMIEITIVLDNSHQQIKPGVYAEIQLIIQEFKDAVVIPRELLFTNGGHPYVFVIENGIAIKTSVTTGIIDGEYILIQDGLFAGQTIVDVGRNRLTNDRKVKSVEINIADAVSVD